MNLSFKLIFYLQGNNNLFFKICYKNIIDKDNISRDINIIYIQIL